MQWEKITTRKINRFEYIKCALKMTSIKRGEKRRKETYNQCKKRLISTG